ncbi:MAG: adenylate/guanylate cyclase domain-containing protein, partial [Chloroflexota bacterium]|nr:adenylate/guanylate cyclase domain-containing protein [Chloroflexota bacterium]
MTDLPAGTVTFLFTDIEGSTRLWERDPTAMRVAVDRHFALLRDAITAHQGVLFKSVGDAAHAAFATAPDALAAALAAQQMLHAEVSIAGSSLPVRMALHTGDATPADGDYLAPALNRLARLLAVGHGGQVLLSEAAHQLARHALPAGTTLRDLGEHRLRDLQPERIFQLVIPDLRADFPPLRTLDNHPNNLPPHPASFIGRERELSTVRALLRDAMIRLVTLTGPGGIGKTRLAVQAAAGLMDEFPDGFFFVDLAPLSDPSLVMSTIAGVLGLREESSLPPRDRLVAFLRDRRLLLVLDNFEQITDAAPMVSELLAEALRLTVLVTSRMRLRLRGEREVVVPPMSTPAPNESHTAGQDLEAYEAVRLFVA